MWKHKCRLVLYRKFLPTHLPCKNAWVLETLQADDPGLSHVDEKQSVQRNTFPLLIRLQKQRLDTCPCFSAVENTNHTSALHSCGKWAVHTSYVWLTNVDVVSELKHIPWKLEHHTVFQVSVRYTGLSVLDY